MIGGYTALAQKLFISCLCDILRPHNIHNVLSLGLHRHTCNNGRVYYHPRNQVNKQNAEKFFQEHNKEFQFWCNLMNWDGKKILQIVKHCVDNDLDRLAGKKAMRAYFETTDGMDNDDEKD